MRRTWKRVLKGNLEDQHRAAAMYMKKHGAYLYKGEEAQVGDITMQQMKDACQ